MHKLHCIDYKISNHLQIHIHFESCCKDIVRTNGFGFIKTKSRIDVSACIIFKYIHMQKGFGDVCDLTYWLY